MREGAKSPLFKGGVGEADGGLQGRAGGEGVGARFIAPCVASREVTKGGVGEADGGLQGRAGVGKVLRLGYARRDTKYGLSHAVTNSGCLIPDF